MKARAKFIVLIILHLEVCVFISAKPFNPARHEVYLNELTEVQVRKRSANFERSHVSPNSFDYNDLGLTEYDVNLKVLDNIKKLKLKLPDKPVFSHDFKLHHVGVDRHGKALFKDTTPLREDLEYIEENTFVDADSDAVLHVHEVEDGFHLDGYVEGARIKRQGKDHVISSRSPHMVSRSEAEADKDVVDFHRPLAKGRGFSNRTTTATVDIAFVVGYEFGLKFKFNHSQILRYLTVMVNSVNTRYSLIQDPKVTFKLTNVYLITTREAQPFIEKSRNGTYGFTMDTVLSLFGLWVGQNLKLLPPHDLVTLLTKVKADSTTSGIAFLHGACWTDNYFAVHGRNASLAVNVVLDDGDTFSGSYTLAHEMAHSLGAPHDGKSQSKDCSWADGHMMSYEGWGTKKKFHFSACSKREMKKFIESTGANCLYTNASANQYALDMDLEVGDIIHPSEQCKFESQSHLAYAMDDELADSYCRRVICRVPQPGTLYNRIMSRNRPPGYHTPCGRGGTCSHGTCINNQEKPQERLDMNMVCVRRGGDPTAKMAIADTPDNQCLLLKCSIIKDGKNMVLKYGTPMNGSFPCGGTGVCMNKRCVGGGAANVSVAGGSQVGGSQVGGSQVGGSQVGGSQVGGSQVGGSQVGGSQVGGFQVNGSQVGGSQVGGSQVGGSQVGGSQVGGSQVGGSQVNGSQVGGSQVKGSQVGGFQVNGSQVGGSQVGGSQVNGSQVNGSQVGGSQVGSQAGGAQAQNKDLDLNRACREQASNPEAKIYEGTTSAEYCKLLRCEWKAEGGVNHRDFASFVFPDNSYPCGHSGKCVNKECVGQSQDRFDMNKECQRKIGDPKASINEKTKEEQCQQLHCMFPAEPGSNSYKTRTYKIVPEDGSFPCGKLKGKCKKQACIE